MLSLPVELRVQTIRHIRDSIYWPSFEHDVGASIQAIQNFYKVLIALSLYHREWTAIAQSKLFSNLYIRDAGKMKLLLELLRRDGDFREYIKYSRSALLGERNRKWADAGGLQDYFDELVEYCPDLEEVSCHRMRIQLVNLGTSCRTTHERGQMLIKNHVKGQFQKLRKLNLYWSDISDAPPTPVSTSLTSLITTLSIADICNLQSPLDPACLPFVRSLAVSIGPGNPFAAISPLLPQLTSLSLSGSTRREVEQALSLSTSLELLSLSLDTIGHLGLHTQAIIRERIEVLRIFIDNRLRIDALVVTSAIISGNRVMKKVIVDGSRSSRCKEVVDCPVTSLVPVCKEADVEIWKENFKVGNGKVDLDSKQFHDVSHHLPSSFAQPDVIDGILQHQSNASRQNEVGRVNVVV